MIIQREQHELYPPGRWWQQICSKCGDTRMMPHGTWTCGECIGPNKQARQQAFGLLHLPNLRAERESQSMPQRELAELTGLSQSFICQIEQGRHMIRRPLARKLAEALGVSTDELAGLVPENSYIDEL